MLTNSLKNSDNTKTEFSEVNFIQGDQKYDKNLAVQV